MTDLEMTVLCAAAMGYKPVLDARAKAGVRVKEVDSFDPLHNDAQAMALVKKLHLNIGHTLRTPDDPFGKWFVSRTDKVETFGSDLNRAIVECAANMQDQSHDIGNRT